MPTGLDQATLQAAAEWHSELREAGADSPLHAAHADWLRRDPRHRRAWQRVEKLAARLGDLSVRADAATDIMLTLKKARHARRRALKLTALLLVTTAAAMAGLQSDLQHRALADHYTATGERQRLQLDDGSVLDLNTNTAIDIDFDQDRRRIYLRQGEIQAQTAHNQDPRPFSVITGQGEIRALGTRFLARREDDHSRVTVLEQAVEITPAAAPGQAVRLKAGQQMRFSDSEAGPIQPVTGRPAAWTRGQLIIRDWSLGEFLDELARYRRGVLRYDEASAALRISGVFHLKNTDVLLDNLAVTLPVKVRRFSPYWVQVEMARPKGR